MKSGHIFLSVAVAALLCVVLTVTFAIGDGTKSTPAEGVLEVHFADVGQGDAIIIRTSDAVVVIDAGPQSDEHALSAYLRRCRIKAIDLLIITHPHSDHMGGAARLLSEHTVGTLLLPKCDGDGSAYFRIPDVARENGTEVKRFDITEKFVLGDASLTPLAPIGEGYDDYNNYSSVFRLDYRGLSFMLAGDAETVSEDEMLDGVSAELLDCDVLKVGHHGSGTSSSYEFLSAVTPRYAVVSCGSGNEFGHPKKTVIERLSGFCGEENVYRTDLCGSIVFCYDGQSLDIRTDS